MDILWSQSFRSFLGLCLMLYLHFREVQQSHWSRVCLHYFSFVPLAAWCVVFCPPLRSEKYENLSQTWNVCPSPGGRHRPAGLVDRFQVLSSQGSTSCSSRSGPRRYERGHSRCLSDVSRALIWFSCVVFFGELRAWPRSAGNQRRVGRERFLQKSQRRLEDGAGPTLWLRSIWILINMIIVLMTEDVFI